MIKQPLLITLAAGLPIPLPFILIAVAVLLLVIVGIIFFVRSSDKKKDAVAGGTGGTSDWQPSAGAWNSQQGGAGSWGQGQQNQWGAQSQPQAQSSNPWGSSPQQQNQWGAQSQPQAQSSNPWGATGDQQQQWGGTPAAQQQQWGGAQSQPQAQPQQNQWGQQAQPQQNQWGQQQAQPQQNQWGQQAQPQQSNPWDATAAAGSPDSWGQPQAQPQQNQWGQQQAQPQQAGGFGGNSSGPSWGQQPTPAAAPSGQGFQGQGAANAPSWQQQSPQGNFGQAGGFGTPDVDRTMLRPNPMPQVGGGGQGYVQVKEGKEPGRIYEIRKESLSIGRSRESDIFLEDLAVSRLHASVVNMGNGNYALKDEGSANGTKVNDQLVNKFQTYPLQEGDRIQLGQTVLVFARH